MKRIKLSKSLFFLIITHQKKNLIRPRKLAAFINYGKEEINTIFIKICSFKSQNAAIDEKGHLFTWGIK